VAYRRAAVARHDPQLHAMELVTVPPPPPPSARAERAPIPHRALGAARRRLAALQTTARSTVTVSLRRLPGKLAAPLRSARPPTAWMVFVAPPRVPANARFAMRPALACATTLAPRSADANLVTEQPQTAKAHATAAQ